MLWWPEDSTWHSLYLDSQTKPTLKCSSRGFIWRAIFHCTIDNVSAHSTCHQNITGCCGCIWYLQWQGWDAPWLKLIWTADWRGVQKASWGSHRTMEHCTAPLRGWLPTHMGHKLMSSRVLKLVQYWINDISAEQILMLYKGLKFFVVGVWRINLS